MIKKIYALAIIALSLGTVTSFAQNTYRDPGKRLDLKTSKPAPGAKLECNQAIPACRPDGGKPDFFKGIKLTADQKDKIEKLESKERKERDKRVEKARKEREKKMEKRDNEMKKILTPAQYEQYKANVKAAKESRHDAEAKKHGKKHGKHDGRPGKDCKKHDKCKKGGDRPDKGCCKQKGCDKPKQEKQD